MLAFIHLSDIHFNKYSGDPYDVDQNITKSASSVKFLQRQLENARSQAEYDFCLTSFLHSSQDAQALGSTIHYYNETFAAQYRCDYTQNRLLWQQSIPVDMEYNLCLVGINSTMISSEEDHISEKMYMRRSAISALNRFLNVRNLSRRK